ncbi:MAG: DUF3131 domain-containing protein [Elusimicrobia bacterium]|nr:DUF3131 domain-containing protein [Elusimicrobiota bacterium]
MYNFFKITLICLMISSYLYAEKTGKSRLTKDEIDYLKGVNSATFSYLDYFVYTKTGMPYDVSDYRKVTSITNIGLYMASLAVAGKIGIIPEDEAIKKLDIAMTSLEKIERWNGFPVTWVDVETLEKGFGASFSYADHVGNLVCSLLVVEGIFPGEFKTRIEKFISGMDFYSTYDPNTGWLKGGYNIEKKDFDIKQPWGDWYYNLLASDQHHFFLLGIALGKIPVKAWESLNRNSNPTSPLDNEVKEILKRKGIADECVYYYPGMEGGGIFMQYLPGIFISEKDLPIGKSARNFARAQIELSRSLGFYPFWGISASESPDSKDYYGWGTLKKHVVTPHASVLAIDYFPEEVVENLKALEKKGMRPVYKAKSNGKKVDADFGFTDSYDIKANLASKNYLCLDQAMLFLSLSNFLYDDVVRKNFEKSPMGNKVAKKVIELEKNKKFPPK